MSTSISPVELQGKKYAVGEFCGEKTTKTLNITRKDSGFRAVNGQRFYVEPMLKLAVLVLHG